MTDSESARMTRNLSVLPAVAQELLREADWTSHRHAYGSDEDIPGSLVDDEARVRAEALSALDTGVLHQGSLYTVTAPAALFLAAILDRDCKTFGVTPDHGRCIDDQGQRDRGRTCRAV
ncbi:hypothetical protein ABZS83_30635 [Streptomyces sp. NPDC005426]|uniref:hypothetical protein n=1 Tax=Streptomyces sp. NPDC005426 TaxID=3155344 RepID=UPI0033AE508D